MKQVIHIFGASGSGTSTLGRKICREFGWFFMDTDDYFWQPTDPPFTVKRTAEERICLMRQAIESHENVVISGALTKWGDELIPYFTLVIRLETAQDVRIARLKAREYQRFGERIAPGGDMHTQHMEFLAWAKSYETGGIDMRSKANHDLWQAKLPCRCINVDGAADLETNFAVVKAALAQITLARQMERISGMESVLNRVAETVERLDAALAEFAALRPEIDALSAYYGSADWWEDFHVDSAGLFPAEFPRGVLSEDGIFNLLLRVRETEEQLNTSSKTDA